MYSADGPEVSTNIAETRFPYEDDLIITCNIEGVPTPSVVWLGNGMQLSVDSRTFINTTFNGSQGVSTLRIVEVGMEEGGLYTCRANSSEGVADVNIAVMVLCKCMGVALWGLCKSNLLPKVWLILR